MFLNSIGKPALFYKLWNPVLFLNNFSVLLVLKLRLEYITCFKIFSVTVYGLRLVNNSGFMMVELFRSVLGLRLANNSCFMIV